MARAGYLVFGWFITHFVAAAHNPNPGLPAGPWPVRIYSSFDAGIFLRLTRHGYFPEARAHNLSGSPAFFPGYPLSARYLADVFGLGRTTDIDYLVALALLPLIGSAVSAVLIHRLAAEVLDVQVARLAVVLLFAGPYSVFLVASYSESVFLALALGAWLAARRDRWWLAGLLTAGAALVRINGLFLAAGLLTMFLVQGSWRVRPVRALSLLGGPLAVLTYFAWLKAETGSWTEWFTAQRLGWQRRTTEPARTFLNSVDFARHAGTVAERFQGWLEILFAAGLLVGTALLGRRRAYPEAVYVGLTAASLLTSTRYLSVPRASLLCFPLLLLVADVAYRHRRAPWVWVGLGLGAAVMVANTVTFLCAIWSG